MRIPLILAIAATLGGCARASTVPLDGNTVMITSQAAPVCGQVGAQRVALHQASVETIRRGFDRFVITNGHYQNNVGVVGYTPVVANTTGHAVAAGGMIHGMARTTYSGGQPIIAGSHNQGLIVKMFKANDPAGANSIDARQELGPKWKEQIQLNNATC